MGGAEKSFGGWPPFSHQQWPQGWEELLSEMGREKGALAAVVGGEGQYLVEAGDFTGLAVEGVVVELVVGMDAGRRPTPDQPS